MTEPTVSLCGTCYAIAPESKWLTSEHENSTRVSGGYRDARTLRHCPACGIGYDEDGQRQRVFSGSWPSMIRKRLDLIGGKA